MEVLIRILIILDENDQKDFDIPTIKQETDTTSDQSKTEPRVKRKYNKRTEPKPK